MTKRESKNIESVEKAIKVYYEKREEIIRNIIESKLFELEHDVFMWKTVFFVAVSMAFAILLIKLK
jgi:hypothetical protein